MRQSGILLPIASLPSPWGIGTLGQAARDWVDFLARAGVSCWQVLPVGPTSYGDSPYQSFSAFAGNPYFIDLDQLAAEGLLQPGEYQGEDWGDNPGRVDYAKVYHSRRKVLWRAFQRAEEAGCLAEETAAWGAENKDWAEDYALYMAVKERFAMVSWRQWPEDIAARRPEALARWRRELEREVRFWTFVQVLFDRQWRELRKYARDRGVELIGDMPIYVAEDGADVWSRPELFRLTEDGGPQAVAGCPPDAFSETGQLWGNPLYDWEAHEARGFDWWISRTRRMFRLFDMVRLDHFRGLEAYYAIPAEADTAVNGQWVKGPGMKLIRALRGALGEVRLIAEDLGFLTPEVHTLLEESGYPGMRVLQFAFESEDNAYLPHRYVPGCVAYTGTHDNDTTAGWIASLGEGPLAFCKEYLGLCRTPRAADLIRGAWGSVAELAVAPIQDFLELGSEARINTPSTLGNNWTWRLDGGALTPELRAGIQRLNQLYSR